MHRAAEIIDEARYPFALIVIILVAAGVTSAGAWTVVTLLAQG